MASLQVFHAGEFYTPEPDREEYENRKRLVLRHTGNGVELRWYEGPLTSGWVIGLTSALGGHND